MESKKEKIVIGACGRAGSGKDTFCLMAIDALMINGVNARMMGFSDALYEEVAEAFSVDIGFLKNRETKEEISLKMHLGNCTDQAFIKVMQTAFPDRDMFSPREVMQIWGTEYRRAQDADYWVKKVRKAIAEDDDHQVFFLTGMRFPNESQVVDDFNGFRAHIVRPDIAEVASHVSEVPLPMKPGDIRLMNDGTKDEFVAKVSDVARTIYDMSDAMNVAPNASATQQRIRGIA